MAKSIEWYCGDGGKIVGPMSFEEVAVRINRAPNEKHLVWTMGMARWADAKTVPAFTDLFRANPPPLRTPPPRSSLQEYSTRGAIGGKVAPVATVRCRRVARHGPSLEVLALN